jgi:hypothetical protein
LSPPSLPRLSKSKLVAALQCERRLWLAVNHPEAEGFDPQRESIFATGHQVGEFARRLAAAEWGDGELIDVKEPLGWDGGLERCREVLAQPGLKVLFEAPFSTEGLGVIGDIIVRHASGELWLIEVKSSTGIKDRPYLDDASFQAWTMAQCGLEPDRVLIRVLDSAFVYPGRGDYRGLFRDEDVTEAVRERLPHVAGLLETSRRAAAGSEPEIRTGRHCSRPYSCGFIGHCQRWEADRFGLPPENPVDLIGRRHTGTLTAAERKRIAEEGWTDLRQLPPDFPADPRAQAIVRSVREGRPWVAPGLRTVLAALPYPRYYFDFETIAYAIPVWPGTSPYQQVPFQWSCHVEHSDGRVEHHEFLDLSGKDPREACAASLAKVIGGVGGVVVVYNKTFEEGQLRRLASDLPQHATALRRAISRMRDLLPIVRDHYYHPGQRGSYGIKAVLPTVAPELDYGELDEVQHGLAAQLAYVEAADERTSPERREQLRERLLAYCKRDTEAMLVLARRLSRAS